jgi:hypothetical protein
MVKIKLPSYWILLQVLWLVGLAISIPSCSKSSQTITDSTCVTRVVPKATDYQVSAADLESILALFKANHLSTANLQFLSYSTYGLAAQVWATPFYNGLPAWVGGEFFTFDAGKYQPGGTYDGYTGPAPNTDTTTHQTLSNLRQAFLAHIAESGVVGGASNSSGSFPYTANSYADSCLLVTLGYMDASRIPGSTTPPETALVKVWTVTALHGGVPAVTVEDDNGFAWPVVFIVP